MNMKVNFEMKRIIFALVVACSFGATANAQIDLFFSTSDSNANAGADLTLTEGATGSMFIWVTNNSGGTIDGLSLDINSSDAGVLEATDHIIDNPGSTRWFATGPGTLGDLVDDSNAFVLITESGILDGETVLHSEVAFDVTGLEGSTTALSMAEGAFEITVSGVGGQNINFGVGSVSVGSAIPEPGSLAVIGLVTLGMVVRRRR